MSLEEEVELLEARLRIMKKRKKPSHNCKACGKYIIGAEPGIDLLCLKCLEEKKACPYCAAGAATKDVCRLCINEGAPICDLCRRPPLPGNNKCADCANPSFTANNFKSQERTESGIPDGSHIINGVRAADPHAHISRPVGSEWGGGPVSVQGSPPRMVDGGGRV